MRTLCGQTFAWETQHWVVPTQDPKTARCPDFQHGGRAYFIWNCMLNRLHMPAVFACILRATPKPTLCCAAFAWGSLSSSG